jgi:S-adenosyl methyltransferase
VVYVDYDPVVVSHGQALLAVSDLSIMVQGDLRRPAELLANPEVRAHLDFAQPVAIGLFATLHFLRDADDPAGTVACLRDGVAPGSYLAISHIGTDFFPDKAAMAQAVAVYDRVPSRTGRHVRRQRGDRAAGRPGGGTRPGFLGFPPHLLSVRGNQLPGWPSSSGDGQSPGSSASCRR